MMNRMARIHVFMSLFAGVVPGTAGHSGHGKPVARPQPSWLGKVGEWGSACGRGRALLVAARGHSGMERRASAFEAQATEQWTLPVSGVSALRLRSDIQGATARCRFRLAVTEGDQIQIRLGKKARAETQARAQAR